MTSCPWSNATMVINSLLAHGAGRESLTLVASCPLIFAEFFGWISAKRNPSFRLVFGPLGHWQCRAASQLASERVLSAPFDWGLIVREVGPKGRHPANGRSCRSFENRRITRSFGRRFEWQCRAAPPISYEPRFIGNPDVAEIGTRRQSREFLLRLGSLRISGPSVRLISTATSEPIAALLSGWGEPACGDLRAGGMCFVFQASVSTIDP
jgi:hypothetical protein